MNRRGLKTGWIVGGVFAFVLAVAPAGHGAETTVQNDSYVPPGAAVVQAGFASGEHAAGWLTMPCNGTLVAVQVAWLSNSGGTGQWLEDAIYIHNGGTFPTPGPVLATLEGPVMTDGAINEFRYLDENQTQPINIPVTQNQVIVVDFQFFSNPDPENGPSVITDVGSGCQNGKNSLFAIPPSAWFNSCSLGLSGDFVIRAVVNCAEAQGACCLPGGTCEVRTQTLCSGAGGNYRGNGTTCNATTCDGACCYPDGSCAVQNQADCATGGGNFKGVAQACTAGLCVGACCLPNGSCVDAQSPSACQAAGGVYKGDGSTCAQVTCTGACCLPSGQCQQVTLATCNTNGGTWNGPATNCGTFTCPQRGACCLGDGGCVNNRTEAECTTIGGSWDGAGTVCGATGVCERACCFPGGCVDLTKSDCQLASGTWQGPIYKCTGSNCPQGACCMPNGTCQEAHSPNSCAAIGGSFRNGLTCAQANCPIPTGACCLSGGGCLSNRTFAQCNIIGGTWPGPNTTCPGACCPAADGDINGDAVVNSGDIQRFCSAMLGTPTAAEVCHGDFDGGGTLGTGDIPGMVNVLVNAP